MQKPDATSPKNSDDGNLFLITIVPLRIVLENNNTIWWENAKPSSTRLCRPLTFYIKKKTDNLTKKEVDSVNEEIAALKSFQIRLFI